MKFTFRFLGVLVVAGICFSYSAFSEEKVEVEVMSAAGPVKVDREEVVRAFNALPRPKNKAESMKINGDGQVTVNEPRFLNNGEWVRLIADTAESAAGLCASFDLKPTDSKFIALQTSVPLKKIKNPGSLLVVLDAAGKVDFQIEPVKAKPSEPIMTSVTCQRQ